MGRAQLDSAVSIPEDVMFRELEGEAIILNLATGMYFGLDAVGTRAWMLLAESGSVRRAVDAMAGEYDVDRATLERDILDLVSVLLDKGLVTPKA
jgi:hypothetical protein